ncbi:MAG TPA: glycosyltransferase family 2 protein, partial [Gammaproteobacteria bacterium]|nr:glycosyltransferase family 2 protein [Gammaproteobacteria bacterium]
GFLRQAMESALQQSYPNVEVIVSDNCSTDDTEQLVESLATPRLRYIRQSRNIGPNNNFNYCLEQARGDYFLLLSDDDLIDTDMVESCMNAAGNDTGLGLIRVGTRLIDGEGKTTWQVPNPMQGLSAADLFLAWFSNKTSFYLCSTLYNTEYLRAAGGFSSPHNLFQDVVATAKLAGGYDRVDVTEVKASFRQHGPSYGSAAKISAWSEDSRYLLDVICEVIPEKKERLRSEGMRYFCEKNYMYTSRLGSPVRHLDTYLMVYRKFDYVYSPFHYIYSKIYKPRLIGKMQGLRRVLGF